MIVNFVFQLPRITGCPGTESNICLGVSVRVFQEETSTWIGRRSKGHYPLLCGWASFGPLRAWIKHKGEEGTCLLCLPVELRHWSSALRTPGFQAFRLDLESVPLGLWLSALLNWPLAFLSLQLADRKSCGFSAFRIMWANSLINLEHKAYCFCFSGRP